MEVHNIVQMCNVNLLLKNDLKLIFAEFKKKQYLTFLGCSPMRTLILNSKMASQSFACVVEGILKSGNVCLCTLRVAP